MSNNDDNEATPNLDDIPTVEVNVDDLDSEFQSKLEDLVRNDLFANTNRAQRRVLLRSVRKRGRGFTRPL